LIQPAGRLEETEDNTGAHADHDIGNRQRGRNCLSHSIGSTTRNPIEYRLDIGSVGIRTTAADPRQLRLDGFTSKLLVAVGITTIVWIATTFLTKPESKETLRNFYLKTRPGGPGWKKVVEEARQEGGNIIDLRDEGRKWEMPLQILCVFIGAIAIYSALFAIGSFVYLKPWLGTLFTIIAVAGTIFLFKAFNSLNADK